MNKFLIIGLLLTSGCSNSNKKNNITPMTKGTVQIDVGQYIVAKPNFPSPIFQKAVILVTQTNQEYITGIRINSQEIQKLESMSDKYPGFNVNVSVGGPVQKNESLLQIHTLGEQLSNSKEISTGLYFMGNLSDIRERLKNNEFDETNIRLFTGYTSWNRQQFEEEYDEGVWHIEDSNINEIMSSNNINLWENLIKKMK